MKDHSVVLRRPGLRMGFAAVDRYRLGALYTKLWPDAKDYRKALQADAWGQLDLSLIQADKY